MLILDGSAGEGGGQILRTSLALSVVTQQPFRIQNIRGRRKTPGLLRQHLTALRAAATICKAKVAGDELGSMDVTFEPSGVAPGDYHFSVGTAGSTTLILQTILPALMTADAPSTVELEGGTHNPFAPPFEFLQKTFLPLLKHMGPDCKLSLQAYGFFPGGGGKLTAQIIPASKLKPIELLQRGSLIDRRACVTIAHLPLQIADREIRILREKLRWNEESFESLNVSDRSGGGPGNVVLIELQFPQFTQIFTAFGSKGVRAESVADDASQQVLSYLDSNGAADPFLADQLLLPFALAGGGAYTTLQPSLHTTTNVQVIERFLPVKFDVKELKTGEFSIHLKTA